MKVKSIMLFMCLLLNGQFVNADAPSKLQSENNNSTGIFKQINPEFLYSYIDFNFDSTTGGNFNRFQGHSNLFTVGADNLVLNKDVTAGIYVFKINTNLNSQFLLAPSTTETDVSQTIHNNTLFAHVLKSFNPQFTVDLAGGYGQNKISSQTFIMPNTSSQLLGFTNFRNTNWFTSIYGIYNKSWDKIVLKTNVGVLYSQINSGSYLLSFQSAFPAQIIAPLTNKVTYVIEGAEIGYILNSEIVPFINGALIQVAQFSNSRPTLTTPINGSLPQLNVNQNGFRVGAGLTYSHKQFSLRLEEKYYNAGGVFTSYQTLVGLAYRFS